MEDKIIVYKKINKCLKNIWGQNRKLHINVSLTNSWPWEKEINAYHFS